MEWNLSDVDTTEITYNGGAFILGASIVHLDGGPACVLDGALSRTWACFQDVTLNPPAMMSNLAENTEWIKPKPF